MDEEIKRLVKALTNDFCTDANADYIANQLNISRNRASSILNNLVKEKKVIKINSRPVLFFDKTSIERNYKCNLPKETFKTMAELKEYLDQDALEEIIGYDGSLENILFQSKAAVSYSDHGLPIMFVGESGTGKTFIAEKMVKYTRQNRIIQASAPFIHINCSEYSNNPDLFLANLFGSVKGAYTGAYKDSKGIIEEADQGYLFLDEVHALNRSCQEKLFQFMDQGNYHRVGDNETWLHADVRLLFATTEYPSTKFLTTFLRRIPVILRVPSLSERSKLEKIQVITFLMTEEERKLSKEITLSENALEYLLTAEFRGNIGELKNVFQLAIANQSFLTKRKTIRLSLNSVSSERNRMDLKQEQIFLTVSELKNIVINYENNTEIISEILTILATDYTIEGGSHYAQWLKKLWETLTHLHFKNDQFPSEDQLILETALKNIFYTIESSNLHGYFTFSKRMTDFKTLTDSLYLFCSDSNYKLFQELEEAAYSAASSLNNILKKEAKIVDYVYEQFSKLLPLKNVRIYQLILFSFIDYYSISSTPNTHTGIIMAHGSRVATEIANAVNTMLNSFIFEGIDLPLEANAKEAMLILKDKIKENQHAKKIAILTDMGSLTKIASEETAQQTDFIIVNSVNPPLALTIGNDLLQDASLKIMEANILEYTKNFSIDIREKNVKKNAIICSCASGKDTDSKISAILKQAFTDENKMKIISIPYNDLFTKRNLEKIREEFAIKFIIGTLDPDIDKIPFVSVGDLIANNANELFQYLLKDVYGREEIAEMTKKLLNEFTLTNLVNELTILNPSKLLKLVTSAIDDLQMKLGFSIPINTCFGLYIHTCCMIERIIRIEEENINDRSISLNLEEEFKRKFKQSFDSIEEFYSVTISDEEIFYIKNYIYAE